MGNSERKNQVKTENAKGAWLEQSFSLSCPLFFSFSFFSPFYSFFFFFFFFLFLFLLPPPLSLFLLFFSLSLLPLIKRVVRGWLCRPDENSPPWKYPKSSSTLGSQQVPSAEGFQNFSRGRHWRLTVMEKARLTMAIRTMRTLSRIRHCMALPRSRMKKRHMEILLNVDAIMDHGCPSTLNSSAREPSDMDPSTMLNIVPTKATTCANESRRYCQRQGSFPQAFPPGQASGGDTGLTVATPMA
jgi:hypothetical protein